VAEREPHVLVVAHRTAATPRLLEEVRRRAQAGPCRITLLVPRPYWDPDTEEAELVVELAVPLLERAAGGHVDAVIGDSDPVEAVRAVTASADVDEVIVSTLPQRVSQWLRRDVPSRVRALGLPVTVVIAEQSARDLLTQS
jgi:Mrp family chromosome partitioning ATPase